MLRIKDVHHMIKDHNLVSNQEVKVGYIQQLKLQAIGVVVKGLPFPWP